MKETRPAHKKSPLKPRNLDNPRTGREFKTRRWWTYRLLTMLLIPAFVLGTLELALRVSGYGYPTSYFVKSRIDDQDFLIPNDYFSYRFFPPALARRPADYRIPAKKPEGVYRIFVLGESAALGTPDWSYGVSRYLDVLLEDRYPDAEFEVICVAMTAINSHVILPIAREVARMDGDLWVIYMGNNEMVGPFGAGTIFGAKAPGLGFVRTSLALKTTRLGQLMASLMSKRGSHSQVPDQWAGINMFKKNLLRYEDPKRLRAYENFEGNLQDILQAGRKAGVPVILSTVGSNLKDCSPFASLNRENLGTSLKLKWNQLFEAGLALEKAGQYEAALSRYRNAAAIDSEFAELPFRMGTCQLALGYSEQARQAFVQARDYDALSVRADSRINQILMNTTLEGEGGVRGIDAEEALSAQSAAGISGQELFYEHVHFTVEGNFTLARIIADQVRSLLPPEIRDSQTDNWMEREACNRQLALTIWDQLRIWNEQSERVKKMPFISQSSNPSNKDYINQQRHKIQARITNNTLDQEQELYITALARAPEDTFLIENYALFLDSAGKSTEAIEQAERFCALLPDTAWPYHYRAMFLARAGRTEEAKDSLRKALELRGHYTQARELLEQLQ